MFALGELVTLDGFPLTGITRDGDWKLTDSMPGWWDRPEPKGNGQSRTIGDGSFKTRIDYDNRLITINGRVISSSHEYLHQAAGIITALGFRGSAKLAVSGHGPAQWATVDPRGSATCEFESDTYLRFQIPLEAIDPFKYGEARTVVGSKLDPPKLYHRGTVPAWPVITVSGSAGTPPYSLTLNGRTVTVTTQKWLAADHVIDFRTGILRVGGAVSRGGLSASSFSPINPGLPQTLTVAAENNPTVTVRYSDTYL